jgi:hypothetical protein
MSMDANDKEWPTPETKLVAAMFQRRIGWQRAAEGVVTLYATRPSLCEISRGHYPPHFVWWVERFVRDELTKWKRSGTETQHDRRQLVLAALDRVEWDALAEHFQHLAAENRVPYLEGMAVRRKADKPHQPAECGEGTP